MNIGLLAPPPHSGASCPADVIRYGPPVGAQFTARQACGDTEEVDSSRTAFGGPSVYRIVGDGQVRAISGR